MMPTTGSLGILPGPLPGGGRNSATIVSDNLQALSRTSAVVQARHLQIDHRHSTLSVAFSENITVTALGITS